jgi:alpha,alpha-trehalase
MDDWIFTREEFDPHSEGLWEALFTLGNGFFATRGAAAESSADGVHYPGTYVAGCYNRLVTEVAGRPVENEDLVNVPNWLVLSFRIDESEWFDLGRVEIIDYRQELHLRDGMLHRRVRWQDPSGRKTLLLERRFVHMESHHLAGVELTLTPENWSGSLEIRSAIDGTVSNAGVARYRDLRGDHLVPVEQREENEECLYLQVRTRQSNVHIAEAVRTRVSRSGTDPEPGRTPVIVPGYVAHHIALDVDQGDQIKIEKIISLFTSRDSAISEPGLAAREAVRRAPDFDGLIGRQRISWEYLWGRLDLELQGNDNAQQILRVHLFHLLQTVSPNTFDLDVGVPARGLHGEAYRGHIFWDELFILPFLDFHLPTLTQALLGYRLKRLQRAKLAARQEGHGGALYPWQSGSDGREESQTLHLNPKSGRWVPDNSRLQRHIGIAVAYNFWHHYEVTGDETFLRFWAVPVIFEIARFFASLCTYNSDLDRYEIKGVMGPDEYHDGYPDSDSAGLNNNAYTNVMAVWLLYRARAILDLLPEHHAEEWRRRLAITKEEVERWDDITHKMRVIFHDDDVISQFERYGDLAEFDWNSYVERYGDIQRLDRILEAEGNSANRFKVSKQADVLMLFYLLPPEELQRIFTGLGYRFDPATDIPRNVDYYLQRTSHGSTLSRVVHSWVLARLDRKRSWDFFVQALESDVYDIQGGTTHEGIHLGAMAGTIDLVQRCYGGVHALHDVLWIDPALPEELSRLRFAVHYRGHRVAVDITARRLQVSTLPALSAPIRVGFRDEVVELAGGSSKDWPLHSGS